MIVPQTTSIGIHDITSPSHDILKIMLWQNTNILMRPLIELHSKMVMAILTLFEAPMPTETGANIYGIDMPLGESWC